MRGATECARRLKKYFGALRAKLGKVNKPTNTDAPTQLIFGILSRDVPESKAREALDKLRGTVVDFNELRVTPPIELAEILGDYPDARMKGEDIVRALNKVFAREHAVTLDALLDMSKKDMTAYLNEIDGLEGYTRARIRLLGLGKHAVPLDEAMWALARREKIVDSKCSLDDAQAFLERQITEEEALEFFALLHEEAWAEMGDAVRAGECERITSIPPDRTTSHMLQDVAPAPVPSVEVDESADAETAETSKKRGRRSVRQERDAKKTAPAAPPDKPAAKSARKTSTSKTRAAGSRTKTTKRSTKPPRATARKTKRTKKG
ncbi:MAG: hypothetical protein JXO22_15935 [Phycisphaerae bacterium]|nr:hypothetical protein [Phycisphaerae bacterium]